MSLTFTIVRAWPYTLKLEARPREPLFLAIARAVREDVLRGRLLRGALLPSSRELATALSVHRNTVLAAYGELAAEGWIETRRARGTFVSADLPDAGTGGRAASPRGEAQARSALEPLRAPGAIGAIGFGLPNMSLPERAESDPAGSLSLSGGVPDTRLIPHDALARALRRAMRARERAPRAHDPLGYGDCRGHLRLRAALAAMMRESRGISVDADAVLVTRGSQMAIDLFARSVLQPGDVVAVEHLGYRPAWAAFRIARAELISVPVDAEGMDTRALARLLARGRSKIRAVYVTPHHQYPTTVTMSPPRRMELLALAQRYRFAILEDDYDHEFHYCGRPVLPLASADPGGNVVYVGTLSKVLAPGLRLGFVTAPLELLTRMADLRVACDRQGDHVLERAVAEMVEDGDLARHVRKARRIYASRALAMAEKLRATFGASLSFSEPRGGTAVWAEVARDIDLDAWVLRGRARGVILHPARRFVFDSDPSKAPPHAIRVGFAHLNEKESEEAIRRMAAACPRRVRPPRRADGDRTGGG